jgi:hypothetical protein
MLSWFKAQCLQISFEYYAIRIDALDIFIAGVQINMAFQLRLNCILSLIDPSDHGLTLFVQANIGGGGLFQLRQYSN